MTDLVEKYCTEILKLWRAPEPDYGGNVLPVMRFYKGLTTYEERRAFQDAMESLLADSSEEVRSKALNQCLGFFVFRDAI